MFSELVVAYLFLGGTGAGACAVAASLGLFADTDEVCRAATARFRDGCGRWYGRFFGGSLTAAAASLSVGVVCLVADAGRPDRLLLLLTAGPTSYVAVGAWVLSACLVLALLCALAWRGVVPVSVPLLRGLCALLLAAAVATAAYTGLLLADMPAVPLWHSWWLPAAFVISSLSCGIAVVLAAALLTGCASAFSRTLHTLVRVDGALILAEAAVLVAWVASVWADAGVGSADAARTATDEAALASLQLLIAGPHAALFWVGLVGVGLALPIAVDVLALRAAASWRSAPCASLAGQGALLASAFCVLIGGACLRAAVVAAGALPIAAGPF